MLWMLEIRRICMDRRFFFKLVNFVLEEKGDSFIFILVLFGKKIRIDG